ncbi:MAG: hypothetical protein ABJK64_17640 [Paraglaciecola sp.]|uniref:hypothetical protein n=1 Tax=Paraglaciecola sp. TaxID=1920173 RepID=UPI00329980EA
MLRILILVSALLTIVAQATPHPFETLSGLKRFDKNATLPKAAIDTSTLFDIKGVKIGDNVLSQAINLDSQGGDLGRIRGGYRSDKIQFSFDQAYLGTRLNQQLSLYFNKDSGFVNRINIKYLLKDSYFDITPVKEQTLQAAIQKYGAPFSMAQAYANSKQQKGNISLEQFIDELQDEDSIHPLALEYLKNKNISKSAKFVKDEDGYALMHTGFDRCYLWQHNNFTQVLSFCFFDKSGANMNGRGVELELYNFAIAEVIATTKPKSITPPLLTL